MTGVLYCLVLFSSYALLFSINTTIQSRYWICYSSVIMYLSLWYSQGALRYTCLLSYSSTYYSPQRLYYRFDYITNRYYYHTIYNYYSTTYSYYLLSITITPLPYNDYLLSILFSTTV